MTLFERRVLTRTIRIPAHALQQNIHISLLAKLREKYEGICGVEGFVEPRSIQIIEHSLGRTNLVRNGVEYSVRFQANICLPHPGQVFQAEVAIKSKIGLHIDQYPLKVLLPRDLHIGNTQFETVETSQMVSYEVIGHKFQQGDETIVVLARLKDVIKQSEKTEEAPVLEGLITAPVGTVDSEKRIVSVSATSIQSPDQARKKKLVRRTTEVST